MKILFLIHSLRRGGAERVALDLANGLANKGHTVQVIAWVNDDEYKDEYPNIKKSYLMKPNEYRWIKSLRFSAKLLSQRIDDYKPDIIQVHTPSVFWLLGLTNNKVPVLHILHGYGSIEYNFSFKGFFKWVISRFVVVKTRSKFITVSPSMNLVAAKFYSNSPDEYTSIQNGIDIKKFPLAPKKDIQQHKLYPKILMIGTLTANKGQIKGIDSFQLLLQDFPNAKLNLIGEGEDRLAIEQRIKNLNLESNVEVLGLQTNIQDFLNQGSILWQLSKTEAMPMAVLESMSIGMPVVGFNVRGINDAIVDNKTGFLVPYGDIELVASKTKIILNDPSLYYKFSSNSRKQIIQNYTHDQMIASYEKVMSKLI